MINIYRLRAAQIIEKWWIRVRNRKVFEVLKRAVCTAVCGTNEPNVCHVISCSVVTGEFCD